MDPLWSILGDPLSVSFLFCMSDSARFLHLHLHLHLPRSLCVCITRFIAFLAFRLVMFICYLLSSPTSATSRRFQVPFYYPVAAFDFITPPSSLPLYISSLSFLLVAASSSLSLPFYHSRRFAVLALLCSIAFVSRIIHRIVVPCVYFYSLFCISHPPPTSLPSRHPPSLPPPLLYF